MRARGVEGGRFGGSVALKNDQIFKKFFFASNEVSTCSECCGGILQLCDECKVVGRRGLHGRACCGGVQLGVQLDANARDL